MSGSAPAAAPSASRPPAIHEDSIRIRPFRADDLPAVLALERTCFTGVYAPHRFTRAHFLRYGRSARAFCTVATVADRPIGYVATALGTGRRISILRLDSLAVDAAARKAGVGSRLLQHALEQAGRLSCDLVALEVAERNRPGLAFFHGRGFAVVRRLPGYYAPGQDALRLQRPVREPDQEDRR